MTSLVVPSPSSRATSSSSDLELVSVLMSMRSNTCPSLLINNKPLPSPRPILPCLSSTRIDSDIHRQERLPPISLSLSALVNSSNSFPPSPSHSPSLPLPPPPPSSLSSLPLSQVPPSTTNTTASTTTTTCTSISSPLSISSLTDATPSTSTCTTSTTSTTSGTFMMHASLPCVAASASASTTASIATLALKLPDPYTPEERMMALRRFREKKQRRKNGAMSIRYQIRKKLADCRPRFRGRFSKPPSTTRADE